VCLYVGRKVGLITAYVSSKAQGYNQNTNITNVTAFSFLTNIFSFIQNNKDVQKFIYREPRPYASNMYSHNFKHLLAFCISSDFICIAVKESIPFHQPRLFSCAKSEFHCLWENAETTFSSVVIAINWRIRCF